MKGSDYFPISKFSAENYANLYRCPGPPHRKSGSEVCRQRKKPRFHAQKQATSGSTAAEGRAGFSRSAEAELPTSYRRFDRAGTMARIQRSTGRGGPANIRQQATARGTLNRLSDNSSPTGKKTRKKAGKRRMAGNLWPLWNSSETDGSQEARLNLFGYTRESPPS